MNIKTQGTQKDTKEIDISGKGKNQVLHYSVDYDSTHPDETLRMFIADIKKMLRRYEENDKQLQEIEVQINDLEHFMEIAPYQNVSKGYKLYRKLAELRRTRRECKSENDLLRPVYDYFHATSVIGRLGNVYGEVSKTKNAINSRCYTVRTSVLDDYIEKEPEPEKIGLNLLTGETCVMEA